MFIDNLWFLHSTRGRSFDVLLPLIAGLLTPALTAYA